MTRKQKAELRLSEIRSKLNEYAGKDSLSAEEVAKVAELEGELRAAEVEQRAAIREEAEQAAAAPVDPGISALERRCELRRYVSAVVEGRAFDGAEAELQQHLRLSGHEVPLAAFAAEPERRSETRADATTNAPTNVGQTQRTVLGRVFARSTAQWLGVRMDQVPAGQAVYPVVSAGNTPSRLAAGTAHGDIAAATIDAFKLEPVRSQVMYSFRYEDAASFGQTLESALRADMSGAMAEHLDAPTTRGRRNGSERARAVQRAARRDQVNGRGDVLQRARCLRRSGGRALRLPARRPAGAGGQGHVREAVRDLRQLQQGRPERGRRAGAATGRPESFPARPGEGE